MSIAVLPTATFPSCNNLPRATWLMCCNLPFVNTALGLLMLEVQGAECLGWGWVGMYKAEERWRPPRFPAPGVCPSTLLGLPACSCHSPICLLLSCFGQTVLHTEGGHSPVTIIADRYHACIEGLGKRRGVREGSATLQLRAGVGGLLEVGAYPAQGRARTRHEANPPPAEQPTAKQKATAGS